MFLFNDNRKRLSNRNEILNGCGIGFSNRITSLSVKLNKKLSFGEHNDNVKSRAITNNYVHALYPLLQAMC